MKRLVSMLLTLAMLMSLAACGGEKTTANEPVSPSPVPERAMKDYSQVPAQSVDLNQLYPEAVYVEVSDGGITINGDSAGVTTGNGIVYYEEGHDFTYGEGTEGDEHSAAEAEAHTVVTITQPGTYVLSGTLQAGQIAVDLGEDAEDDPEAVVTLVLNGLDITCTVAPAVIFYNVYECGDQDPENASYVVDTSAAGANVVIPDGTVNQVRGSYVARIYKSVELSEDGTEVINSKKLHKYDAAFYSKMTMNLEGGETNSGVLNIVAENEGLDSELHLTINGGYISITSGNDGINTNEDEVSVTTINDGTVRIVCDGSTGEGDGIDSNGWLVINGGIVYAQACATSGDAGIDSDMGIYLNGGTVMASGNMLDRIAGGEATYAVFQFAQPVEAGTALVLKNADGQAVMTYQADNRFQYLVLSNDSFTAGDYTLWADEVQLGYTGALGGRAEMREFPEDFDPENLQLPEGMEPPEDMKNMGEPPELPDGENMRKPEDMENMTPPNGEKAEIPQGGFGGGRGLGSMDGQQMTGEMTEVFSISAGSNQFNGVAEYVAAEASE